MGISWRHVPQAPSAGVSIDGYDPQHRIAVRVVKHTNGWRAYLRGNDTDRVDYRDVEAAMQAAEAAFAAEPQRARLVRERFGRKLRNRPVVAPHPGVHRERPQ